MNMVKGKEMGDPDIQAISHGSRITEWKSWAGPKDPLESPAYFADVNTKAKGPKSGITELQSRKTYKVISIKRICTNSGPVDIFD